MNFCIVTSDYPNNINTHAFVFLQNFAWTLRDLGHEVIVICPTNTKTKGYKKIVNYVEEKTLQGNNVKVYFPKYFSPWIFSKFKFDVIARYNERSFLHKVKKVLSNVNYKPDVLYAQFLNPAGIAVASLKKEMGNSVIAISSFGESSFWCIPACDESRLIKKLNQLDLIEAVSTYNKKRLLEKGIKTDETVGVFPNGIDRRRYMKLDRTECRRTLKLPENDFIVAFLGAFIERKGIDKLNAAAKALPEVSFAYAGKGPLTPDSVNVVFSSELNPEDVPCFLSAADVFCLPTINEGCCNAIIEAMACGLPIISTNLPFNDDILNENNSIRIEPGDINGIIAAIELLKVDHNLREKMSAEALRTASNLKISDRVENIINFIEEKKK